MCATEDAFRYISNSNGEDDIVIENMPLDDSLSYEDTPLISVSDEIDIEEEHISISVTHEMELDESFIDEETEDEDVQSDVDFITETEQVIVDQAQPLFEGVEGQYSPYFSDYTSMMLYTWITKHQICRLHFITLLYFLQIIINIYYNI